MEGYDTTSILRAPLPMTWERSFFAALRALRHLYFQLEQARLDLHSNCAVCDEIRNFLSAPDYRSDDWKAAFISARGALAHLYTKLEADGMELHATGDGCDEIREFLASPQYRGNLDDPLGVDMHRPSNYAQIVD